MMSLRYWILVAVVGLVWPWRGMACEAYHDTGRQRLVLPQVWVGSIAYRVELAPQEGDLVLGTAEEIGGADPTCEVRYDPLLAELLVPRLNLSGRPFEARLTARPGYRFPLDEVVLTALPTEYGLEPLAGVAHQLPLVPSVGSGALSLERVFADLSFSQPVLLTQPPAERRLFVVEQGGRIQTFPEQGGPVETFLDLTDRVQAGGEEGLLGLAFDPGYADNGLFYVYYSAGDPRRSVIARFSTLAGPGSMADAGSERVILEVAQPYSNHNAGTIAFGPDGYLYIALGDGGSGGDPLGHGQNGVTLLGAILRIDPSIDSGDEPYTVPADNPFVGNDGVRDEIWAYGLRNPYRFSFDRESGALWAADVGQNSWEEVDLIVGGGNYGWNVYEGEAEYANPDGRPPSDFQVPIWSYGRDQGVSVIGGYVYRGLDHPALRGKYLFGDFGSGHVWALSHADGVATGIETVANLALLTGFGEDRHGELYLLSYDGAIHRMSSEASETTRFPETLSATGLFSDVTSLTPAAGVIPYDVNSPLWTDGAHKRRWMALPAGGRIGFSATDAWLFPVGTVLIKHLALDLVAGDPASRRPLETRLLVRQRDGWRAVTYRWRDDGSDARLLSGAEEATYTVTDADGSGREQRYLYPSEAQCMRCHNPSAGIVLGPTTRQLNRDHDYGGVSDNQLRALAHAGLFDREIGAHQQYPALAVPASDDREAAARAYLDTNCAFCHHPGGPVPVTLDLRHDTALAEMGVVNVSANSESGALVVAPGDAAGSLLWQRMGRLDATRMPPLGSSVVDDSGRGVIAEWIDGMAP